MRKSFALIILLISMQLQAQIGFYVEANGNMSLISKSSAESTIRVESELPLYERYKHEQYNSSYQSKLGGNIQAGINYFFSEQFSADGAIDLCNTAFGQKIETATTYYYLPNNSLTASPEPSYSEISGTYNLFLLSLPISLSYYTLEDNKLAISLGAIPGMVVGATGANRETLDFNKFMLGIQIQARFEISPQWWLTASLREYSTKLYEPSQKLSFSSLRMINLGIRYSL